MEGFRAGVATTGARAVQTESMYAYMCTLSLSLTHTHNTHTSHVCVCVYMCVYIFIIIIIITRAVGTDREAIDIRQVYFHEPVTRHSGAQ